MKIKDKLVFGTNLLIFLLEIIGLLKVFKTSGRLGLAYYTQQSNILSLVASLLFIVFFVKNKTQKFPKNYSIFKYLTVVSLIITFLVVIFILAPQINNGYYKLLLEGPMLYIHFLCPIISLISYLFLETHIIEGIKDSIKALYFTFFYAVIIIVLNLVKIVDGPYPFLKVYSQPFYMTIMWALLILLGSFGVSCLIREIKERWISK